MSQVNLETVSSIYHCSGKSTFNSKVVKNTELKLLSISIDKFIRKLDEAVSDEYWRPVIKSLKSLRFELCSAPLPNIKVIENSKQLQEQISDLLPTCTLAYPNFVNYLSSISKLVGDVSANYKNEIAICISEILHGLRKKDIAVLIKEPRLISYTEEVLLPLHGSNNISVVTPELLKDIVCFDKIIVIGPPRWFPDYIFTAPRAKDIIVIKHSWIKGTWSPKSIFPEQIKQRRASHGLSLSSLIDNEEEGLEPESLLPPILDLEQLNKNAENETHNQIDYVEARGYLLEGDWAVFLEADDEGSVLIIDLETGTPRPVKRIKMRELETGMFLLLRTSGGGDFIIPVANKIMGESAPIAREYQQEWKRLLRKMVRTKGYDFTIRKLVEHGSRIANKVNINNWMFERSIRTEDFADFKAIMTLVGLQGHIQEYWEMMKHIDIAHQQAGVAIRKMLLAQVQASSIQELKRTGIMEFSIPGENVSITAFRINQISDAVVRVMPWRIGALIKQE